LFIWYNQNIIPTGWYFSELQWQHISTCHFVSFYFWCRVAVVHSIQFFCKIFLKAINLPHYSWLLIAFVFQLCHRLVACNCIALHWHFCWWYGCWWHATMPLLRLIVLILNTIYHNLVLVDCFLLYPMPACHGTLLHASFSCKAMPHPQLYSKLPPQDVTTATHWWHCTCFLFYGMQLEKLSAAFHANHGLFFMVLIHFPWFQLHDLI